MCNTLRMYEFANNHMTSCLKQDPEHKKCKEMFRLLKKIGNLRKAADAVTAAVTPKSGKDDIFNALQVKHELHRVAPLTLAQAWDDFSSADAQSTRLQAARAFGKCQVFLKTNEWHSVIKHCTEAAGEAFSTPSTNRPNSRDGLHPPSYLRHWCDAYVVTILQASASSTTAKRQSFDLIAPWAKRTFSWRSSRMLCAPTSALRTLKATTTRPMKATATRKSC